MRVIQWGIDLVGSGPIKESSWWRAVVVGNGPGGEMSNGELSGWE